MLSDWMTGVLKGKGRPDEHAGVRLAAVREFTEREGIEGRAVVTDLVDFTQYSGIVDVFIYGEEQRVRWNWRGVTIPRTRGYSTTDILKREGKV